MVEAVLVDIDGVLVVSWQPVPGAAEALARLRSARLPMRFLTNTTSATVAEISERLGAAGIEVGEDEILTAGVATADHLERAHPGAPCLLLNEGPMDDLRRPSLRWTGDAAAAEVVVIGAAGPSFTWEVMNDVLRALHRGAALVAMHGTRIWQTADGPCLDGGAYVDLLEAATGVTATVVGKPAPGMFEAALAAVGCRPEAAAMVGDDINSDVLAAQAVGCVGVLVRTGKFRAHDLERADRHPDHVVDSIADVPDLVVQN